MSAYVIGALLALVGGGGGAAFALWWRYKLAKEEGAHALTEKELGYSDTKLKDTERALQASLEKQKSLIDEYTSELRVKDAELNNLREREKNLYALLSKCTDPAVALDVLNSVYGVVPEPSPVPGTPEAGDRDP